MAEIVSLSEAISAAVHDGDTVAMEGFTHLIPSAAAREVIRQRRRDLTLVRMTPDVIYDQMIGAGCARKLVFSWGGNPGVGSLHRFRDAVEHSWPRPLQIEEHSHAGMANRYVAGASGLPFAVLRGYNGTGLARQGQHRRDRLPVHRGAAGRGGGAAAGRDGDPRAAGRPGRQRAVLGDHRGAEGGGARARRARWSRSKRSSTCWNRGPGRSCCRPGRSATWPWPRRLAPLLRAGLLDPRQRLLRGLGRDQPGPGTRSAAGSTSTSTPGAGAA